MKTRLIVLIIACIVLASFTLGTVGAVHIINPSANEAAPADKLIGVFITREHLDLFDSEGFLKDNMDQLMNGKKFSESDSAKYQERLYATIRETGNKKEYVFENIEGISLFAPWITDQSGDYWSSSGDDAITDGQADFRSTDEGDSIHLEGTVYVSTGKNLENFYFNPVYQTSAGEVYAVTGNGMDVGEAHAPGQSMSHEIKEDRSSASGGSAVSSGTQVNITVCFMDEPSMVSILQFNSENALLSKTDCEPGSLPKALQAQPDAQYIIVETRTLSQGRPAAVTREIYQPKDGSLSAFCARDDGICVKQWCEIEWSGSSAPSV